jgi:ring-1,2-phenylacetyl-CoA epoxidase subunit PaaB
MKLQSLDPRVNRLSLDDSNPYEEAVLQKEEHFQTYQVFHQKKRGDKHLFVGVVHAPSDELAMVFAKEQYGRRGETTNLWVVNTRHVLALEYEDADIFATTTEKLYRDPAGFKVNDKIDAYKKSKIDV